MERPIVRIMSRTEWGARPPLKTFPMTKLPRVVVIFPETDTEICETRKQCIQRMQEVQKKQMDKGYPDVKHNFFIGMDGRAYEGTGWKNHGVNLLGHPKLDMRVLSICHIGNFKDYEPFYRMRQTADKLIKYGHENNFIRKKYRKAKWRYEERELQYDEEWYRYQF